MLIERSWVSFANWLPQSIVMKIHKDYESIVKWVLISLKSGISEPFEKISQGLTRPLLDLEERSNILLGLLILNS